MRQVEKLGQAIDAKKQEIDAIRANRANPVPATVADAVSWIETKLASSIRENEGN